MRPTCVKALLNHSFIMPVSSVHYQYYSNVAWSLAVMGYFDFNIVDTLLHKLTTKHDMLVQEAGSRSSSAKLVPADVTQLYQAVAWLKQPSGSKQMEAWSNLLSRLRKLAQEPTMTKLSVPGQAELCAALAMQGVPYKAQVPCGMHWAHAVLSPHNISAADVLLMLERPEDFITNVPSRLQGHVAFRNEMLKRYGTVVAVPYSPHNSNTHSMAAEIKAAVEAKTGLPLDAFRS